jgi:hypothetical protein
MQSRSFGSHTQSRGLEDTARARIDATEAVRQLALGQKGRAFSLNQPTKRPGERNIADVITGETITPEATAEMAGLLGDSGVVVPTANGYRIIGTHQQGPIPVNSKGVAMVDDFGGALQEFTGQLPGEVRIGKNIGGYSELDWEGGNATKGMLEAIDSSGMPGPARLADSPETRQIMGELSAMYRRLEDAGQLKGNQKLNRVLEAWSTGGLDAVRTLVEKGLAPSVVLGLLAAHAAEQDPGASIQNNM